MHRLLRLGLAGTCAGLLVAGTSVAGALLERPPAPPAPPVALPTAEQVLAAIGSDGTAATTSTIAAGDTALDAAEARERANATIAAPTGAATPDGTFLVGAATATLHPAPEMYGGRWQTEGCTTIDSGTVDEHAVDHTISDPRGWPAASPDCIYLGGFGIGPARAAKSVDSGGVFVRSIAISNGQQTFTYSIADTVGWFARYDAQLCSDCGILDVRERLAHDLGIDVGGIVVSSTHTHAGADTYGGWGGIPPWYRAQLRDAALASVKQAVANLRPATIEVGEVDLRRRNEERRDTYYSTVDTGATWLQATSLPATSCTGHGKKQTCSTTSDVIATLATFGAHPTMVGGPVLHADWPGAAARAFEATHGGVGLLFEGALGNSSVDAAGDVVATGRAIANEVSASIASTGHRLAASTMKADARVLEHPVTTNPGLVTLGAVGLFDREFHPGTKGAGLPGVYTWSRAGQTSTAAPGPPPMSPTHTRACTSAGPTVRTTAGAHRIGDLVIAFAPGEIFGTLAEVVKERADGLGTVMVLGQSNDALGYIIQSFEFDSQANVATEYGTQTAEYEEVFALDRCLGDHVLETILQATAAVGAGR